ncbi:MAG: hypothetical protein Kow0042_19260 [Calditrichia bacterium]
MDQRIRRFIFFVFTFLMNSNLILLAQTGIYVPEMAGVDSVVLQFRNNWNIPGISVAISKEGRLVYARGFGYADTVAGELVQPWHRFRIASVSKPITSVAILKLLEANQLSLDDFVFGPQGILNDSIYANIQDTLVQAITIRHLLQHTAGWDSQISGDPMFDALHIAFVMGVPPPPDPQTIIRYMLHHNLNFPPGTQFAYSNFGYCVLGRVIEKLSGLSYAEYADSVIFKPIGATSFALAKNLMPNAAPDEVHYYDYPGAPLALSVYGTGAHVPWPYGGFNIEAMDSHGGWIASPVDLLRFVLAVDGFASRPDILTPATIHLMRTPSTVNPYYALGWIVNNLGNWWHNGSLPGTSALLVRISSGQMCWAVLVNTRPADFNTFNSQLDAMMWDAVNTVTTWPTHDLFDSLSVIKDPRPVSAVNNFRLFPNYPNPFNTSTKIRYRLETADVVGLSVYDIQGQVMAILKWGYQPAGDYSINWDASSISSGLYFIVLQNSDQRLIQKAVLIK